MSVGAAFVDGWRRVQRAPLVVLGLWGSAWVVALPLSLLLRDSIASHLGSSQAAEAAVTGVNFDWWNEFLAQATGLDRTFVPAIIGFGAVLKNLSSITEATTMPLPLVLVITGHLGISLFLLGGALDRLARDRATSSYGFFAACGVFTFRFLRLMALAGVLYAALFLWLHPWLFEGVYVSWTREVTAERTAFALRVLLYLVFGSLLMLVNLVVDYAKIRMVVEDRRSAVGALIAAVRFIRRQPAAAIALYGLNASTFLLVLAFYFAAAPSARGGPVALLAGFAIAQFYLVLRVIIRLTFAASQIALFQGRLAHAGYTARPLARWPDSPAAEAIRIE